MSNHM